MKKAFLLALLAAVAAVVAIFLTRPAKQASQDRVLPGLAPENIAQIQIRSKESQVTLKLANGTWTVEERGGYPADGARTVGLLRRVWELRPVQSLPIAEADLPRLELNLPAPSGNSSAETPAPSGTLVTFFDSEGRELAGLVLGKRHMREGSGGFPGMAVGRYVRNAASPTRAALVSETFDETTPAPQTWLDREFVKISNPTSIRYLPAGNESSSWQLVMENGAWKLADAKKNESLDASKAALAASALGGLSFSDLGPERFQPSGKVEVETEEGIRYVLEIGPRESGDVPLRISADILPTAKEGASLDSLQRFIGRTFLVPGFSLDNLAVERSRLLTEPPPSPTPSPTPAGSKKPRLR